MNTVLPHTHPWGAVPPPTSILRGEHPGESNAGQQRSAIRGENPAPLGQRKCGYAVSAIIRSEQGKKRRILTDGQQLPIQWRPSGGAEIEGEGLNLSEEWLVRLSDRGARDEAGGEDKKCEEAE